MKVTGQSNILQNNLLKQSKKIENHKDHSPDVVVNVRKVDNFSVSQNNPKDPTVATKVLDSLSTGVVNFSQSQRDAIAKVLSRQAKLTEQ